jgi:hypothetical protein
VYPVGVRLVWPIAARGRPLRQRHVPDILSMAAEDMLAQGKGRISGGELARRKSSKPGTAVRVRRADGLPQRIRDNDCMTALNRLTGTTPPFCLCSVKVVASPRNQK